jgi:hypothetical protein
MRIFIVCDVHQVILIKEDEIDWVCSAHCGDEKYVKNFV